MLILPNSDVSSDLTKSNGALANWEHIAEGPLSPDGNNLTSDGTGGGGPSHVLVVGLDFEGLLWDADLWIVAAVTGTFPLYSAVIYDAGDSLPYFSRIASDVLTGSLQILPLAKNYPDHHFVDPQLQLHFQGVAGNTLTLKAVRLNGNIRGSGGQSARNTSILVPTFGSL